MPRMAAPPLAPAQRATPSAIARPGAAVARRRRWAQAAMSHAARMTGNAMRTIILGASSTPA
eukprot:8610759-Pyramimonas_sp.AAC.1